MRRRVIGRAPQIVDFPEISQVAETRPLVHPRLLQIDRVQRPRAVRFQTQFADLLVERRLFALSFLTVDNLQNGIESILAALLASPQSCLEGIEDFELRFVERFGAGRRKIFLSVRPSSALQSRIFENLLVFRPFAEGLDLDAGNRRSNVGPLRVGGAAAHIASPNSRSPSSRQGFPYSEAPCARASAPTSSTS